MLLSSCSWQTALLTFPEELRLGRVHNLGRNRRIVGHVVLFHVLEQTSVCYFADHLVIQSLFQELRDSRHRVFQVLRHRDTPTLALLRSTVGLSDF